jgi:phytol kinase
MAAAAWPGIASSQCALLLSRSPPTAGFALAPAPGSSMRRRLLLGVGTPAVLQDGAATLFVTAGAYTLVRAFDMLTERRLIQQVSSFSNLLPVLIYCKIQIFWPLCFLSSCVWMGSHFDFR